MPKFKNQQTDDANAIPSNVIDLWRSTAWDLGVPLGYYVEAVVLRLQNELPSIKCGRHREEEMSPANDQDREEEPGQTEFT